MIITKSEPFNQDELERLKEQFETYIKTVIDINNKVCSAGMNRHFEGEKILLRGGSKQSDIWGGGVDLETKIIDFNSFINIRQNDNNNSNEIQNAKIRKDYEELTKFFLKELFKE